LAEDKINLPEGFRVISPPKGFQVIDAPVSGEIISEEQMQEFRQEEFVRKGMESGDIVQEQPGFLDMLQAKWPQIAGSMVGAGVGAATFGPDPSDLVTVPAAAAGTAKFLGGVAGAGLGGAAGKGYQQAYRMNQPGAKPMTMKEIYSEQLLAGIEEAGSELAGRGIAKGVGAGARFVGRKMVAPGAQSAAKLLRESGLGITLAQATDNRLIDIMESIAEGSLFGGGRLQTLKIIQTPKAINKAVGSLSDDFATALGKLSPEEAGELILDAVNQKNTAFNRASRSVYKQVDKLVKQSGQTGDIVDITPLKKFARQRLASKVDILRSTTGDTLLRGVDNLPSKVSLKQASSLRSALSTQTRTMSVTKDVALGVTKQLTKMSDAAIEKSGKELSGEAYNMWRFANKFHREGKQVFNSKLVRSLKKTLVDNPEKAVPRIFQREASKQIRLLRTALEEKTEKGIAEPAWDTIKHSYLESILKKGRVETGDFIGKKFLSQLDDDILNATFSAGEVASIKNLGNAVELLQRPTTKMGGGGSLVIKILQAGAIYNPGEILNNPTQAAVILSPIAMATIATSKKWSKLLIEGMKDPVGKSAALVRLSRIAAKIDLEAEFKKRQSKKEQERRPPIVPMVRKYPSLSN